MNDIIKKKKLIKSSFIFIILVLITFIVISKDCNPGDLLSYLSTIDARFILLGAFCMFIFITGEALNLSRILKKLGNNVSLKIAYVYAATGFFFSGITPSSIGGQPLQLYVMNKTNIKISHGSIALLTEVASFQIVGITVAIIGCFVNHTYLLSLNHIIRLLIMIGIGLNIALLLIILSLLFLSKISRKISEWIVVVLKKLHFFKKRNLSKTLDRQLKEYTQSAMFIRKNPFLIFKTLLTSTIQLCAMYSVTYFVFAAFGLTGVSWINIITLQAILSVAVAIIPLPGTVGANESGFILLFSSYFLEKNLISPAMIFSRGINFYLCLLVTGIVFLFWYTKRTGIFTKRYLL